MTFALSDVQSFAMILIIVTLQVSDHETHLYLQTVDVVLHTINVLCELIYSHLKQLHPLLQLLRRVPSILKGSVYTLEKVKFSSLYSLFSH